MSSDGDSPNKKTNKKENLGNNFGESSPLSILAEVASMEPNSGPRDKAGGKPDKSPGEEGGEDGDKKSGCTSLRELLTKTAGKVRQEVEYQKKIDILLLMYSFHLRNSIFHLLSSFAISYF